MKVYDQTGSQVNTLESAWGLTGDYADWLGYDNVWSNKHALPQLLSNVSVFVRQVLAFQRHFRCFPCAWFEPCRENVTVFHGPKEDNKVIGRVTQSCCGGCCTPKLNILSRKGDRELVVKGPCVIGDCCGVRFDVLTDNKKKVRCICIEIKMRFYGGFLYI